MNPFLDSAEITTSELEILKPVVLAVIGPTNEGKTSVLRTLTGDPDFGEINAFTGTTVRAEIQKVFYRGQAEILQIIDTPGFQMSGKILDLLEDGKDSDALRSLTASDILRAIPEEGDFRHDWRAWREVAEADILLYIVNAAESPEDSLQRDTLTLLTYVRKPVITVFNNVPADEKESPALHQESISIDLEKKDVPHKRPTISLEKGKNSAFPQPLPVPLNYQKEWTEAMKSRGFYLFQVYDAHRRKIENELEFFDKITLLVNDPLAKRVINAEKKERFLREQRRFDSARRIIARFLVDLATMRETEETIDPAQKKEWQKMLTERLNQRILNREHTAHLEILSIWDFPLGILDRKVMNLDEKSVSEGDHFFGDSVSTRLTMGAGIGAGVGFVLDLALGGLSLGTGTTLGAAIGAFLAGGYSHIYDAKKKKISVLLGRGLFNPLLGRAAALVQKLSHRGKAVEDRDPLSIPKLPPKIHAPNLFAKLNYLNRLAQKGQENRAEEDRIYNELIRDLESILPNPQAR